MDIISQLKSREIQDVEHPTEVAFTPLLEEKRAFIQEVPVKTFRFADGDRGQLDVYYPFTSEPIPAKTPVLFYIYGGGFVSGDRRLYEDKGFGLVYRNVAAFFARRGFVVIIPDYRLSPHVMFPAPVEDVRDAVRWVVANPESLVSGSSPNPDLDNIFMMGHSAGGAHISSLHSLTDVLPKDDPLREKTRALVLMSPPFDNSPLQDSWYKAPTCKAYWGSIEICKERDPISLLRKLDDDVVPKLPEMLLVEAEHECDWLAFAGKTFHKAVKEKTGKELELVIAKGHNHISINWALCTGKGDEWAEEVAEWLKNVKTK